MRLSFGIPPPCGIDEVKVEVFTAASLHRGFCKCELELQARSTEPERALTRRQSNWFHWSALPGNWQLRLDSASQKVAPRLEPRAPVAGTPGTLGPCDTQQIGRAECRGRV